RPRWVSLRSSARALTDTRALSRSRAQLVLTRAPIVRRQRLRHVQLFLCAFVVGIARTATATAPTTTTEPRARALFDEAGALERCGQWAAAQERLRAALRLRETPQLHFALGWALENEDKLIEAKLEYETAARLASPSSSSPASSSTRAAVKEVLRLTH